MRERGAAMGAEFKGKGVHVALGPMMNLMRVPAAGRNWEGYALLQVAIRLNQDWYLPRHSTVEEATPSCPANSPSRPSPVFNRLVHRLVQSISSTSGHDGCTCNLALLMSTCTSEQEHFRDSSSSNVDDR